MGLKPIMKMLEAVEIARTDSDRSLFSSSCISVRCSRRLWPPDLSPR